MGAITLPNPVLVIVIQFIENKLENFSLGLCYFLHPFLFLLRFPLLFDGSGLCMHFSIPYCHKYCPSGKFLGQTLLIKMRSLWIMCGEFLGINLSSSKSIEFIP